MNLEQLLRSFALDNGHKILNIAFHPTFIFIECIIENVEVSCNFQYWFGEWEIRSLSHSCDLVEWENKYKALIQPELNKIESIINQQGEESCC